MIVPFRALPAIVLIGMLLNPIAGAAQEAAEEGAAGFSFRYSLKSSALLARKDGARGSATHRYA